MGTYISLSIKDNKGDVQKILTQKGGIGTAILCFNEEDIHYEKNKSFYFKISPIEAVRNLEKVISNINTERYSKYDNWTEKTLAKITTQCMELANKFMMCEDDDIVYCDMTEYLCVLKDDFKPEKEILIQRAFVDRLVQGSYEGMFVMPNEHELVDKLISDFKTTLLAEESVESILNFGTTYDAKFIKMGTSKMIKFKMDITLKKEYCDNYNNFENFYHNIFRTIENLEIAIEHSFESTVENGFRAIFYTME